MAERYAASLAAVEDEYLRERAGDMRDIATRVLNNLLGNEDHGDLRNLLKEPSIVVAHDLTPSQTAQMDRDKVLGFATDVGSRTSHTAIMARSMEIPAVVGLAMFDDEVRDGWWPVAVAAFAISVAASIVLCGAEARLDLLDSEGSALEVEDEVR